MNIEVIVRNLDGVRRESLGSAARNFVLISKLVEDLEREAAEQAAEDLELEIVPEEPDWRVAVSQHLRRARVNCASVVADLLETSDDAVLSILGDFRGSLEDDEEPSCFEFWLRVRDEPEDADEDEDVAPAPNGNLAVGGAS